MNLTKRVVVGAGAGALALGAVIAAAPIAAQADAAPVTVTVSVTPDTTVVGGQATVVATVTNNTSSTVSGAMGIENPQYSSERITAVSGHACAPRNLQKLIYCGNTQLAPRATMSITLSLTATSTGTDNFTAYGRITGTNDTLANGTLTVS